MEQPLRRVTSIALGVAIGACNAPQPAPVPSSAVPSVVATPAAAAATPGEPSLPETVYQVEWVRVDSPTQVKPSESVTFKVTLKNISPVRWPGGAGTDGREYTIRLAPRWLKPAAKGAEPEVVTREALRAELPDVRPGETVVLDVRLTAPEKAGPYQVQFDLVYENVAWFSLKGAAKKLVPVTVG